MGRPPRDARGGMVYHVLNRANARMTIFEKPEDYQAFETVLQEAVDRFEMRLLAYCLLPKSLAPGRLAEKRQGSFPLHRLADPHPYAAVARAPSQRWDRSRLSGPFQVVSRPEGRILCNCLPLCGAKCPACKTGRACRGMAVGQSLALERRECQRKGAAQSVAREPPSRLGKTRERAPHRRRTESDPSLRGSRQPLRRCEVDQQNDQEARPGKHCPPPRQAAKEEKRFLTPFYPTFLPLFTPFYHLFTTTFLLTFLLEQVLLRLLVQSSLSSGAAFCCHPLQEFVGDHTSQNHQTNHSELNFVGDLVRSS